MHVGGSGLRLNGGFDVFGIGVLCRILYSFDVYLYVSRSGLITSDGEERAIFFLLLFTCNYVVSVRRGFFFLLVLGMGYVIFIVALPEPSI